MFSGIRASDPRGLNKRRGSKLRVGSRVRQEMTEEGRRTQRPKYCEYKDEDNSPNTPNDYYWIQLLYLKESNCVQTND